MQYLSSLCLSIIRYGEQPPAEPTSPIVLTANDAYHHPRTSMHDTPLTSSRSGQILWIRGLTRLQTQVGNSHACLLSPQIFTHTFTHNHIQKDSRLTCNGRRVRIIKENFGSLFVPCILFLNALK